MAEAPGYALYSYTPPHTRALWARSVDAAQSFPIPGVKYYTLNERWLKFEPVTSCHVGSDTMSWNQLSQKLILMVEASRYIIYSYI